MIDWMKDKASGAAGWAHQKQMGFGDWLDTGLAAQELKWTKSGKSADIGHAKEVFGKRGMWTGPGEGTPIATHIKGARSHIGYRTKYGQHVFGALGAIEDPLVDFANRLGKNAVGAGFKPIKSLGGVARRIPMGGLATSYMFDVAALTAMDVYGGGKSLSLSTLGSNMWASIPFTIGSELAGGGSFTSLKGLKSIGTFAGYQMLGEHFGLGSWGSLGLQVLGSSYMPGLGWALGGAVLGSKLADGITSMNKMAHKYGMNARGTEFTTGDHSFRTAEAATMRQRSLAAIQKSQFNMRNMLGREASILMGR